MTVETTETNRIKKRIDRIVATHSQEYEQKKLVHEVLQLNAVWQRQATNEKRTEALNRSFHQLAEVVGEMAGDFSRKTSPYERVEIELKRLTKIEAAYEEMKAQRDELQSVVENSKKAWQDLRNEIDQLKVVK